MVNINIKKRTEWMSIQEYSFAKAYSFAKVFFQFLILFLWLEIIIVSTPVSKIKTCQANLHSQVWNKKCLDAFL